MIRVMIVDDNPVIRGGLVGLLGLRDDMRVVGQAGTGKDAIVQARAHRPHVILMDVRMPVMDGVEATAHLALDTKVLMLTYTEDQEMVGKAIQAGARGYLVHGHFTPEELGEAIVKVHGGGAHLSPTVAPTLFDLVRQRDHGPEPLAAMHEGLTERELEVMNQIATGRTNAQIAEHLYLSEKTIKNHINRVYTKLGVKHRAEAIATWLGTDVEA